MTHPMTLQEAQTTVDTWIRSIGVRYYGEQSFKTPDLAASARTDLADEMADVLFVLICLANQTGVDLNEALHKNLDKKTRRDADRHRNNPKLRSEGENNG